MKKVALSLLAFALVGSMAFGQDAPVLKVSGYLNTGLKAESVGSVSRAQIWGDDAGNPWGRLDLNGSYANTTSGVEWRLRTANNTDAPKIEFAYAWSTFADGLVTVKAGKVDDGTFSTAGDIGGDFTDTNSILLFITPLAGLNIGASYFLDVNGSLPLTYSLQAAYTADKLAKVEAAVKVSDAKLIEALVGLGILAVDKLTLKGDAKFTDLATKAFGFEKLSLATISETVEYAVTDAFSAGILSYQYVYGSDLKDDTTGNGKTAFGYYVKPYASYTIDPMIAVGANVKYATGQQGTSYADIAKDTSKLVVNSAAFVEVNPSITFTLSPAAKIIVGYVLDYSLDKDKIAYRINSYDDASQTKHTAKIDFRYNF